MNTFRWYLELAALGNLDSLDRLVSRSLLNILDLLHNVVTLKHLSKDDVATVEPAGDGGSDEELTAICVLACVRHAEETLAGVLELEVLVGELFAVNGLAAGA